MYELSAASNRCGHLWALTGAGAPCVTWSLRNQALILGSPLLAAQLRGADVLLATHKPWSGSKDSAPELQTFELMFQRNVPLSKVTSVHSDGRFR